MMEVRKCKTLEEFETTLRNHEVETTTKYVLVKAPKGFKDEKVEIRADQKLHWQNDVPYFHFGTRTYTCHQGVDTNISKKKKYLSKKNSYAFPDHCYSTLSYKAQTTKKLGCPAGFNVTRVVQMPEYKALGSSKHERDKMSRIIKSKILAQEPVGEEFFIFNLPKTSDHKFHLMGIDAAATEPVDKRVREKIVSFVEQGERDALVIKALLSEYVVNELQVTEKRRRRFYPDLSTIRKLIATIERNLRANFTAIGSPEIIIEELPSPDNTVDLRPCSEIQLNECTKEHLINECTSILSSLESMCWCLEEDQLKNLSSTLKNIYDEYSSHVTGASASQADEESSSQNLKRQGSCENPQVLCKRANIVNE